MSYDIDLVDPDTHEVLHLPFPIEGQGGTYILGGSTYASFNATYNYAPHFRRVLGEHGIRSIYGMTGAESQPVLLGAIGQLGEDTDADYWKPTEGNARQALMNLYGMACALPHGIWQGD